MATISSPRAARRATAVLPMYPAPPVTTTRTFPPIISVSGPAQGQDCRIDRDCPRSPLNGPIASRSKKGAIDARPVESVAARDRCRRGGGDRAGGGPATRRNRADCLGELRQRRCAGGGWQRADEQVRRGLPREAVLRRL